MDYWKEIKKMLNQKCECGGVYLHKNKNVHEKTISFFMLVELYKNNQFFSKLI